MREAALISELARAIVPEVKADTSSSALLAFALALALATTLRTITSEVWTTAIEAVHALASALVSTTTTTAAFWAITSKVVATAVEAFDWTLAAAALLALTLAFASSLWAIAREVVAAAIEALNWSSHDVWRSGQHMQVRCN
eukprot:CAMPEP_0197653642 /NCGR_PEP_ID=MMETSP1338-20131121/36536_1 /TAXON_ID=43686 ORGANISM="Pelagodinium beii, Strain RCC1491" /NCGR_SAMPLE_ID=MMETSP1338 /ASSEMBLY_ACC=CAM_ASM_000754 /LENGTH=141 /DNA_ID=CAMNT_0043228835 /DNA_START=229 /DNA_END=654 /DNA_ORIENTATION=+